MKSTFGLTLCVACAVVLAACDITDLVGHRGDREVALLIIHYGDTARINAPDTVSLGAEFEISFSTFGDGCTQSISPVRATVSRNEVQIRPRDRVFGGGTCPAILRYLPHTVNVRIDVAGPAVIHIVGEQEGAPPGSPNSPAEISRSLFVR